MQALQRIRRPKLAPVLEGEGAEGQQVVPGVEEHGGHFGELGLECGGDPIELRTNRLGTGLGEDGADGGREHLGVGLGDLGQDVPHEVDLAALPGGADEDLGDGRLEPEVVVGDDQAHAS